MPNAAAHPPHSPAQSRVTSDAEVVERRLNLQRLAGAADGWKLRVYCRLVCLIGCVALVSFDTFFPILIGWLIYCLAGIKQLPPNISISHLWLVFFSILFNCFQRPGDSDSVQVVCLCVCARQWWRVCLLAQWLSYYHTVLCPAWYLYNEASGNGMHIICLEGLNLGAH